jgi:hypothetical protein
MDGEKRAHNPSESEIPPRRSQGVMLTLMPMVVGDWAQHDDRDRAFEVRTLRAGDLALVKGGGLHALANSLDENVLLFMLGG